MERRCATAVPSARSLTAVKTAGTKRLRYKRVLPDNSLTRAATDRLCQTHRSCALVSTWVSWCQRLREFARVMHRATQNPQPLPRSALFALCKRPRANQGLAGVAVVDTVQVSP